MSKRKAKRLYRQALASYRDGYIRGAQGCSFSSQWADDTPAHWAGYVYGRDGVRSTMDRLPLDVWARVIAKHLEP
jgi:hypothetical protein